MFSADWRHHCFFIFAMTAMIETMVPTIIKMYRMIPGTARELGQVDRLGRGQLSMSAEMSAMEATVDACCRSLSSSRFRLRQAWPGEIGSAGVVFFSPEMEGKFRPWFWSSSSVSVSSYQSALSPEGINRME